MHIFLATVIHILNELTHLSLVYRQPLPLPSNATLLNFGLPCNSILGSSHSPFSSLTINSFCFKVATYEEVCAERV